MAAAFLTRFNRTIGLIQRVLDTFLGKYPPDAYCFSIVELRQPPGPLPAADLIDDGFLWAVPKSRRTIEKRWKRKYGVPEYVQKILQPKSYIRTCNTCGDDHLVGVLCPTCYKKVIEETKLMQETIESELKLKPVDKEIVVLYEGERDGKPDEFWEGKRVVEVKKERPSWFSKNLLQETTRQPATTSDVKPSDLG